MLQRASISAYSWCFYKAFTRKHLTFMIDAYCFTLFNYLINQLICFVLLLKHFNFLTILLQGLTKTFDCYCFRSMKFLIILFVLQMPQRFILKLDCTSAWKISGTTSEYPRQSYLLYKNAASQMACETLLWTNFKKKNPLDRTFCKIFNIFSKNN